MNTPTTSHTVKAFDQELAQLTNSIVEMGAVAETIVSDSIQALINADLDLAKKVIQLDTRLDILERDTEELVANIIARRQPVGSDLREVMAALRIANDIERIGDLAKNISRRAIILKGEVYSRSHALGTEHLTELTLTQLKSVLDAYTGKDQELAKYVWSNDTGIDALYTSIFRELLTYMMEDPRQITTCTHLLFCAKNLERIGDHATNIAETTYYMVSGQQIMEERPKQDMTSMPT